MIFVLVPSVYGRHSLVVSLIQPFDDSSKNVASSRVQVQNYHKILTHCANLIDTLGNYASIDACTCRLIKQ